MIIWVLFSLAIVVCRWQTEVLSTSQCISLFILAAALAAGYFCLIKQKQSIARPPLIEDFFSPCSHHLSMMLLIITAIGCGAVAWFNLYTAQRLSQSLAIELYQQDVDITVDIASLPVKKHYGDVFRVRLLESDDERLLNVMGQTLLMNNYGHTDVPIHACQRWQMRVRLKPLRGLANAGGFDYQAFMLEQGIQIKGYIREATLLQEAPEFCIDAIRGAWRSALLTLLPADSAAWIVALSIGDKSLLNHQQKQLLQRTGSYHLFVISGLHIGLVAAAIYQLVLILRFCGGGLLWMGDWRPAASLIAYSAALFYGLMAGWQLPVQRALLTLAVFMLGRNFGFRWGLWSRFWFALALLLFWQPLAPLNNGFILSFTAVFFLLMAHSFVAAGRSSVSSKSVAYIRQLLLAQWGIILGLAPLMLLYFQQVSLLSVLVNVVLIPLMSVALIPLLLITFVLWLLLGMAQIPTQLLLALAAMLESVMACLQALLYWREWEVVNIRVFSNILNQILSQPLPATTAVNITVLLLAAVLMLGPRIPALRVLAVLLCLAVFLSRSPRPAWGEVEVTVLDVGQGLSVLIETYQHQMLYDTGAAWPDGSMVNWVLKPLFHYKQIVALDNLMISHGDNDHAGGLKAILDWLDVGQLYYNFEDDNQHKAKPIAPRGGVSETNATKTPLNACEAGLHWQWDGVDFSVLQPQKNSRHKRRNDRSCVLLIRSGEHSILLTGDIEKAGEVALIANPMLMQRLPGRLDVLLVPHHGSKTSSTQAFTAQLNPHYAIVSAGFLNRFRHPHPQVLERYHKLGSQVINTAYSGAVAIYASPGQRLQVEEARESGSFWQKQ